MTAHSRSLLFPLLALALTASLPAQVYGVGPGRQFASIGAALAAVPDGAVIKVLDSGPYQGFTVDNKSVTILAPGGHTPKIDGGRIIIRNLAPGRTVRLQNFGYLCNDDMPLLVENCQGSVTLERIAGNPGINIRNSSDVYLNTCGFGNTNQDMMGLPRLEITGSTVRVEGSTFAGSDLTGYWDFSLMTYFITAAGHGALVDNSRVVFHQTNLSGGDGPLVSGGTFSAGNDPGGNGLIVQGRSQVTFMGGSLKGGVGGDGTGIPYGPSRPFRPAQPGGSGLVINNSTVTTCAVTMAGGSGGWDPDKKTYAPSGQAWVKDPAGTIDNHPYTVPPKATFAGTMVRTGQFRFGMLATANSMAVLLIGTERLRYPLTPYGFGWVTPAPMVICGPHLVPANGMLALPDTSRPALTMPMFIPLHLPIYCQFVTYDPGPDRLWASNLVTIMLE